ncbi:hypothetical protein M426DRAFT_152309 [Hypoxylon sp. CI-4A]|nr:hypothetical protein M426DRAFT_152309 [Hypoxylon sp. CI-4A]
MGSYVSVPECQARYNITLNCAVEGKNTTVNGQLVVESPFTEIGGYAKGEFPGDPDIAGIGILGVFVAVTSFAIAAGLASVVWQSVKTYKSKAADNEKKIPYQQERTSFSDILETLVLACSDQQVFTGAAYAITLRYWRGCTISAYHYNIVANMMLLTCATHLISVTIVRNYWKFPWLALLRVVSITFVFIVTGLLMTNQNADTDLTFPTSVPNANATDSSIFLPAACFQTGGHTAEDTFKQVTSNAGTFFRDNIAGSAPGNKIQGWNLYIITLLFYGAATIAEFIRFFRRGRTRPGLRAKIANGFRQCCGLGTPMRKIIQNVFLFYLALGVGIACAVTVISTRYIFDLRRWVDRSAWIQQENNQNPENDAKSFGQLVPIFSSALVVFSFAQIVSEKLTRRNNRKHDEEDPPPQVGTIQYLDPSSYDILPPRVPEKEKLPQWRTTDVSTTSLPRRVDSESQMSWDNENSSVGRRSDARLASRGNNAHFQFQSPTPSSQLSSSPPPPPPPALPLPARPEGPPRYVRSISSRGSGTPPRNLMGSPNVSSQESPLRVVGVDGGGFSARPNNMI